MLLALAGINKRENTVFSKYVMISKISRILSQNPISAQNVEVVCFHFLKNSVELMEQMED